MGVLLWARDITTDIDGVKNTYSSWDTCMTKAYCKWPAIVGIILGALIVLSILSCLVRCLCCGAECCCGCLSCCNACCPSPRRRHQGYQQQPPPTPYQQYPMYNQYQPPPQGPMYGQPPPPQGPMYNQQPPVYSSGGLGYRGAPQTATFDTPSSRKPLTNAAHADSLPPMPTWDSAHTRQVEDEDEMEEVEMEKLVARPSARSPTQATSPWSPQQHPSDPHQPLYPPSAAAAGGYEHAYHASGPASPPPPASPYAQANPYADHGSSGGSNSYYYAHDAPAAQTAYPPSYRSNAPAPPVSPYGYPQHGDGAAYPAAAARAQEPSGPPTYRSNPAPTSGFPPPAGLQVGRRPVQNSWREV